MNLLIKLLNKLWDDLFGMENGEEPGYIESIQYDSDGHMRVMKTKSNFKWYHSHSEEGEGNNIAFVRYIEGCNEQI